MSTTVRGFFAPVWDRAEVAPGEFERIAPNSIINRTAPLRCAHDPRSGANFTYAQISQNEFGYKFEATIPDCQNARGLVRMIENGCNSVSMCFRSISARQHGVVTVVEKARLTEISIVESGAYPSARVWIVGREVPPDIQDLVEQWNVPARAEELTLPNPQGQDDGYRFIATVETPADDEGEDVEQYGDPPLVFVTTSNASLQEPMIDPVPAVRSYMKSYMSRCPVKK